MKFSIKLSLLISVVVVISACMSSVNKQTETLSNMLVCCSSIKELSFSPLQNEKRLTIEFSAQSKVFLLDGEKSYVYGFEVPNKLEQKNVRVKSFFNGMFIGPHYEAQFIFLDTNFEELERIKPVYTFYDGTLKEDAHMLAGFRIPIAAKYALIYAESPYVPTTFAVLSDGSSMRLVRSPVGKIQLDFFGQ